MGDLEWEDRKEATIEWIWAVVGMGNRIWVFSWVTGAMGETFESESSIEDSEADEDTELD